MFSKECSVDINAPVEQVFAYVTDVKRHPEWSNNRMDMVVHGEPVVAGTTFESMVNVFGKESTKGKVIEMEPPTRFVYECDTSMSGIWRWTMSLEPIAGGTRLRHRMDALQRPTWFAIVQPVMFPILGKKMMTTGLSNIKARVEAGAGQEAAA
jgi:uncharacterized protein YndB with AHSA1/START domain